MERRNPVSLVSFVEQQQFDEKNIRRRVYDALNVLMAMDIISKDKKEIQWKGLPRTSLNDIEELKVCSLWNTLSYFIFTFVRNFLSSNMILFPICHSHCILLHTMCLSQSECIGLRHRLEKKAAYLQELEDQVRILSFRCFFHFSFWPICYHLSFHKCPIIIYNGIWTPPTTPPDAPLPQNPL